MSTDPNSNIKRTQIAKNWPKIVSFVIFSWKLYGFQYFMAETSQKKKVSALANLKEALKAVWWSLQNAGALHSLQSRDGPVL